MKKETFDTFWNLWTAEWLKGTFKYKADDKQIVSLCRIKSKAGGAVFDEYEKMKETVKFAYFYPLGDDDVKINRYKRAAVLSYLVLKSNPLIYDYPEYDKKLDVYFLKQRLAFFIGIGSIIQSFDKSEVEKIQKPIYNFSDLGPKNPEYGDEFLMSVYKDMFFSELYDNYNVLTMANVYGLLTERASHLMDIIKDLPEYKSPDGNK